MAVQETDWRSYLRVGMIAGLIAVSVSLIGMVETFNGRAIIGEYLSLGNLLLYGAIFGGGFVAARQHKGSTASCLAGGLLLGAISGVMLNLLVLAGTPRVAGGDPFLRQYLLNVNNNLLAILLSGLPQPSGSLALLGISSLMGMLGAAIDRVTPRFRRPLLVSLGVVLLVGLLSEVVILAWGVRGLGLLVRRLLFARKGLSLPGAVVLFLIVFALHLAWTAFSPKLKAWTARAPERRRKQLYRGKAAIGIIFLLFLPFFLRTYLTEVVDNVGLYVLMGLGLNIVVGYAGLLDLGYVAFFAIGAYTMGVLTSQADLGIAQMSFWSALPFSVMAAVLAGIILGVPVLRMRGDYLAIVTLGFGEIIRILVLSDALAPFIGGAQGILKIPKAQIGDFRFVTPESLYYLILIGCLIAVFLTWRLRDSRLGRQWMAMREDEDVAEAMGINLVSTKLLAFGIGAAFSGLSGAIFATKLSSIFPHSFNLLISINVLCLIIVGGMGSIPGVVVGALVLVGLPELLREFAEYRLLMYGALLIVMMIARPEGFWPSAVRRRELRGDEEPIPEPSSAAAGD